MMFTSVRIRRLLQKNEISFSELILSNILLILGGWLLGFGSARADVAGFAMAVSGGVMLFSGIVLGARLFRAVTRALQNANNSLNETTEHNEDVEDKTLVSSDHNSSMYNNLQNKVEHLEKDAKVLAGVLRRRGSSLFGR